MESKPIPAGSVYRAEAKSGWQALDKDTDAMIVPGGMVIRTMARAEGEYYVSPPDRSVALVFVPCDAYDRRDWLNGRT